ncbi:MAG: homocysteine S-methyltransferase family protein [Phycisphaerales bacterium]|nr:homocysteine S-methyltransferase family protein [Phycisphaerales bacterium]
MNHLEQVLQERILILDGAMGTMIQKHRLQEADYRGKEFAHWKKDLKGNNDLLSITKPSVIEDIHLQYYQAGADIVETNTFNAQRISLADYQMEEYAYQFNIHAVACAQNARKRYTDKNPDAIKYIAGSIGPMSKTLSISPDVNNPGFRTVTFQQVTDAYYEQVKALVEGGVDVLLIETIFDTLNAKAAIYAVKKYFLDTAQPPLPLMISGTITDASGRTLSGQTMDAFYVSVMHAHPLTIGLNCALGPAEMRQHVQRLSQIATCFVSAYPNAGLPNAMGEYDQTPSEMALHIKDWAEQGFLNIVGGCCGTTPDHIAAIKNVVQSATPRHKKSSVIAV